MVVASRNSMVQGCWVFGLVAASKVLFRAGFKVGLIPAAAFQAKTRHGQQLFQLGRLAGRTVDQRRIAELLNGFHLVTAGSALVIVNRH